MNQTLQVQPEKAEGPKYVQVRRQLLEQMEAGTYTAGQPLPGERSLSASLGVAMGTLRRALRELESDGFIRRVQGKGTFINSLQEQRKHVGTNMFSVILPTISSAPYPDLIEGLEQAATGIDHQVVVCSSGHDLAKQEKLIRFSVEHKVAGVVIVPAAHGVPSDQIELLETHHIPVVFCHRAISDIDAPLVTWSYEEVGTLTADTFVQYGHRRIVSLMFMRQDYCVHVIDHIRSKFESHGIDESHYRVLYHGEIEEGEKLRRAIHEVLSPILRDKDRPTAIHCVTLQDAEIVYLLAAELGLRIPEDLSLLYFGGASPKGELARRIASVARDEHEVGRLAGDLLAQMCSHEIPLDSNRTIEVPLTLLPGETLGPAPGSTTPGRNGK